MKLLLCAGLAFAALAGSTPRALACNPLLAHDFGKHATPTVLPAAMLKKDYIPIFGVPSIVGLWHDVHTASDGTLFLEGYDTWNADGTENELGNLPPATGALCVGVWRSYGRTVALTTHVAWLYSLTNEFVGTLNITEQNEVSYNGTSFSGTFDARFFDPKGHIFQEVTGTTVAERLQ